MTREQALRKTQTLSRRMPFGPHRGHPIAELPPEYCTRLMADVREFWKLGPDLQDGIRLRVKIKAQEAR